MSFEEEKEEELKKSNRKLVISIVVLVGLFIMLLLLPTFTKMFEKKPMTLDDAYKKTLEGEESETNYLYNGYSFVKVQNLWYTEVQIGNKLYNVPLHYSPREVENVTILGQINDSFHSRNVYITFDPSEEDKFAYVALSAAELSLSLVKAMGVNPIAACTENITEACLKRPIVRCEDGDKAIIYLKEEDETLLGLNGNCIVIQGKNEEMLRVTDRLILQWYGIMK